MKKKLARNLVAVILAGACLLSGCGTKQDATNSSSSASTGSIAAYNVDDYVTLGEYKGLKVEYTKSFTVSDEEVEQEIQTLLENATTYVESTRTVVEDGDKINLDYQGKIDGEVMSSGTAEGSEMVVGQAGMIPGFESQIVGAKLGESFDINVTFPETYLNTEIAGKPAVFTIKVNKIYDTKKAELNDDFVKSVSTKSNTVAELRAEIKNDLQESRNSEIASYKQYYAEMQAIENASVSKFPDGMIDKMKAEYKASMEKVALSYDMTLDAYIEKYAGMDMTSFDSQLTSYMESQAKIQLVLEAICKKESLTLSEDKMKEKMLAYATEQGYSSLEDFLKVVEESKLREYLQEIYVLDFITGSATIVEAK